MALLNDLSQRFAVVIGLGYGFAEVPRLAGPIVDNKLKVMGRDSTANCLPARFHCFNGCPCRCVLEDNSEARKRGMKAMEPREKRLLGIEDSCVLRQQ
jgi:hypothetical protein